MLSFFLLLYKSLGNKLNQKHSSNPKTNLVYAWGKNILLKGEGRGVYHSHNFNCL
ncbi:MAG: hypothetical protein BAJALOKI3v1_440009 [Promethearchaeota archaeon]|nr:MAG: hypothetical protein BAJALOKI3v1_440009 [Candidatus Lokiarchaeota archaeon]